MQNGISSASFSTSLTNPSQPRILPSPSAFSPRLRMDCTFDHPPCDRTMPPPDSSCSRSIPSSSSRNCRYAFRAAPSFRPKKNQPDQNPFGRADRKQNRNALCRRVNSGYRRPQWDNRHINLPTRLNRSIKKGMNSATRSSCSIMASRM